MTVRLQRGTDCWAIRPPLCKRQLCLNTLLCTKLSNNDVGKKIYPEDSSGTSHPKLCCSILHKNCGCLEESFGPFLFLPAEIEHSGASILITEFALQWFAFPKLSSRDKGDSLLYFLLIKSWVTPLQSPWTRYVTNEVAQVPTGSPKQRRFSFEK